MVNYLLAAAVFCLVVTLSSAALVSTIPCTNGDECDNIDHSTCDTGTDLCKCNAAYKDGTGGDEGKCVAKGLGDPCGGAADCAGVDNSECATTCKCIDDFTAINNLCKKGLGNTCSQDSDCVAVTGATCKTNCVCEGSYKVDPADSALCKQKGLGDPCDTSNQNGDCAAVSNAVCIAVSGTDKCACAGKYKESGGMCVEKGLNDPCSAPGDCVAVAGATCNTNCVCQGSYKVDPADNTKCKQKGFGDSCSANGDCTPGDANSECSSGSCICKNDFTAIDDVCKKGLGNTCTNTNDCSGVLNSACSGMPLVCACVADYTPIDNLCQKGLNNTCSKNEDCSAVSNAVCVGTPLKCACRTAYEEINGQCSNAYGLHTLLSTPVAVLLSFLTIVATRLH